MVPLRRNACDVYVLDVFLGIWKGVNRQMKAAILNSTELLTRLLSRSDTPTRWNSYKMAATLAIAEGA